MKKFEEISDVSYINYKDKHEKLRVLLNAFSRTEKGLSLNGLAIQIGIHYITLSRFLKKKETVAFKTIVMMTNFINKEIRIAKNPKKETEKE